jgi:hypothetical protein
MPVVQARWPEVATCYPPYQSTVPSGDSRAITVPEFTTLIGGLSFTECPRWRDGRLYVSDFYTQRVLAVAIDGTAEIFAHVPRQPSGLGFLRDGRMLIVSMRDRKARSNPSAFQADSFQQVSPLPLSGRGADSQSAVSALMPTLVAGVEITARNDSR